MKHDSVGVRALSFRFFLVFVILNPQPSCFFVLFFYISVVAPDARIRNAALSLSALRYVIKYPMHGSSSLLLSRLELSDTKVYEP